MALNLTDTAGQIDGMASELKARQSDQERRMLSALRGIEDFQTQDGEGSSGESDGSGWAVPVVLEPPGSAFPPPELPADFTVASVDGSQIDADRHLAARCFLINTGVSVLTYGSRPDADLSSRPRLYAQSDELVIRDPVTYREQAIEGAVLGADPREGVRRRGLAGTTRRPVFVGDGVRCVAAAARLRRPVVLSVLPVLSRLASAG